jgi:hypothetical protein
VPALSPLPLLGTPHDANARPHQSPVSRTRVSCQRHHSVIVSRYQSQTLSRQSTPQAAATPSAIGRSMSQGRRKHLDRGSLQPRLEPASPLHPDHRQGSIPIGRHPRSAASFNQASVQSRAPAALHRLCPDAGSRRTLNHSGDCDQPFRPKVITDSGDRDHAITPLIVSAWGCRRSAPSTRVQVG